MKYKAVPFLIGLMMVCASNAWSGEYMSAEEVTSAFSGKTTEGHHAFKDKTASSYLSPDGKLSGTGGTGTWRVDNDGKLCIFKESRDKENCRHIRKDGDTYKKFKGDKHIWTYTSLTEGNTKNFELAE